MDMNCNSPCMRGKRFICKCRWLQLVRCSVTVASHHLLTSAPMHKCWIIRILNKRQSHQQHRYNKKNKDREFLGESTQQWQYLNTAVPDDVCWHAKTCPAELDKCTMPDGGQVDHQCVPLIVSSFHPMRRSASMILAWSIQYDLLYSGNWHDCSRTWRITISCPVASLRFIVACHTEMCYSSLARKCHKRIRYWKGNAPDTKCGVCDVASAQNSWPSGAVGQIHTIRWDQKSCWYTSSQIYR